MSEQSDDRPKGDAKYELGIKKIKKIYENYGINTSDMSDEELDRLYHQYSKKNKSIDDDLRQSEKCSSQFGDDVI